MEDTDMASPSSNLHASSASAESAPPTSASHTSSHPASTTEQAQTTESQPKRSRSKARRTMNDGYIYEPYKDYSRHGNSKEGGGDTDADVGNQASATRILELRGLERRIVQLLETAGQAIQILSGDDDEEDPENDETGKRLLSATSLSAEARQSMIQDYADERSKKFEALAAGYATLVNEIQGGLRRQFHYLTKAGISSSQVPFKNVVYGEEKELETWLNAVDVLKESTEGLIGKVERELLKPNESLASASLPVSGAP